MTTKKQLDANRRNALLSTGPRTPEGKVVSRWNSLRHGLCSEELLIPGESPDALVELREDLRENFEPEGPLEEALVDRIIAAFWRLRRLGSVEAGMYLRGLGRGSSPDPCQALLSRFGIEEEERTDASSDEKRTEAMGLVFTYDGGRDGDNFLKLARCEASIERSLYRALHELQRLQEARRGRSAPLPVAVDVELSAGS